MQPQRGSTCCTVAAEEVESLARFAQDKLGRIDIWVSCQLNFDTPDSHCSVTALFCTVRLVAEGGPEPVL